MCSNHHLNTHFLSRAQLFTDFQLSVAEAHQRHSLRSLYSLRFRPSRPTATQSGCFERPRCFGLHKRCIPEETTQTDVRERQRAVSPVARAKVVYKPTSSLPLSHKFPWCCNSPREPSLNSVTRQVLDRHSKHSVHLHTISVMQWWSFGENSHSL